MQCVVLALALVSITPDASSAPVPLGPEAIPGFLAGAPGLEPEASPMSLLPGSKALAATELTESQPRLAASTPQAGAEFGSRIAMSQDTLVVGADREDGFRGAAYVYVRVNGVWTFQDKLVANDGSAGDRFGWSVAIRGDTIAVGAFGDDLGPGDDISGSVYIFTRAGGDWFQRTRLVAADRAAQDFFGYAVALGDGDLVVGAFNKTVSGAAGRGAAYIFTGSEASWVQQPRLTAADGAAGHNYGVSVGISGDTAVVGALFAAVPGRGQPGALYAYVRDGGVWALQQKLAADDGANGDALGDSVSISGDTVIGGATAAGPNDQGAAYVFVRSGTSWSQQTRLLASDGVNLDRFGYTVNVSGESALIGAWSADRPGAADAGAGYAFARSGTTWVEAAKLVASDALANDNLGIGLALDGTRAALGAPKAASLAGRVYTYELDAALADARADATANPNGDEDDQTGTAVAATGDLMVVGAPEAGTGGRAYVFRVIRPGTVLGGCTNTTPGATETELLATLELAPPGSARAKAGEAVAAVGDKFGGAVAISRDGDTIAVGLPGANGSNGRVAVFTKPGADWGDFTPGVDTPGIVAPPAVGGVTPGGFGAALAFGPFDELVVGAPDSDVNGAGDAGMAHVYRPQSGQYASVTPQNLPPPTQQLGSKFGASVAAGRDRVLIGAPLEDNAGKADLGAAYLFRATVPGGNLGSADPALRPSNGKLGDKFGTGVAVSGTRAVIGAPGSDTPAGVDSGAGYLYGGTGSTLQPLVRLDPQSGAGQGAGSTVGMAGEFIAMGARLASVGGRLGEGTTYLYEEPESGWESLAPGPPAAGAKAIAETVVTATAQLEPAQSEEGQEFGAAAVVTDQGVFVGAPFRDGAVPPGCGSTPQPTADEGAADTFFFDRILRNGFEGG